MRLSIIQSPLIWEKPEANRTAFTNILSNLAGQTDLVVLPEMFTTGFSMNAAVVAETMDGPTVKWMQAQAKQLDAALTGSFICREGDSFRNRLLFVRPDGNIDLYDKRHLFTLAREDETFTSGRDRLIVEWKGWRICPLICYDLRFPAWSRQPKQQPYDLLIYVANWPAPRSHHWRTLLAARAIENQCYVAGVNIVGTDGMGLEYLGDTGIYDYSGRSVCQIRGQAGHFTAQCDKAPMLEFRSRLAFLADSDELKIL